MDEIQAGLEIGSLLRGQYRIMEVIGEGAMGTVYLVEDEREQQRRYVLKEVMHSADGLPPCNPTALKRLEHPALPQVHRVFANPERNRSYILMDFVEGSNLNVIRQLMPGRRLSLHAAMALMSPILDAVSYLHQQNPAIVHGDIKLANIIAPIAGVSSTARLVDLGGARELAVDAQPSVLNFRAPEQFTKRASRRSDVYALGCVFYALLTGATPRPAPERLAKIEAGEGDILFPENQFTPFARAIALVIKKAMAPGRRERFGSVEQFRETLWQVARSDQAAARRLELSALVPDEQTITVVSTETESMELPAYREGEALIFDDDMLLVENMPTSQMAALPITPIPQASPAVAVQTSEPIEALEEKDTLRMARKKDNKEQAWQAQGKRWQKKRVLLVLATICVLVSLFCSGGTALAYQQYKTTYQNETIWAKVGTEHLQRGTQLLQGWTKKPLDASAITTARSEFSLAQASFTRVRSDVLGYASMAGGLPILGTRIQTALHLATAANDLAQAGITGCDVLALVIERFREPLSTGHGLTNTDLAMLGSNLHQIEVNVNQASVEIKALKPGDLSFDARIGQLVEQFQRALPQIQGLLHEVNQVLPVLPSLLGVSGPAFYLVEILDPAILRPGGGVIKDYGFATFIGGRLVAAHVTDANLLDTQSKAAGSLLKLPKAYNWFEPGAAGWKLRDSNLDADFPTAARYAAQNYASEGGRAKLQGVIAITPTLMAEALKITKSIAIPELHENIDSSNLLDRLHYYQLGPGSRVGSVMLSPTGPKTAGRYFTELLAQNFLKRVRELPASVVPDLLQLVSKSLRTKDVQLYFNAAPAQHVLELFGSNATIMRPEGDSFFLVDANISENTANQFLTNTLNDQISIDEQGNVAHRATLRYAWSKEGTVFGSPIYSNYARVYVPPGSVLKTQQGWQARGSQKAFERQVWAGSFTLTANQEVTVTLGWTEKGMAKKDAAGVWHYSYLIQRQAGANWTLQVGVKLPSCATGTRATGGLSGQGGSLKLSQILYEDTRLGVDYRCL